jgi:hypothetical protein
MTAANAYAMGMSRFTTYYTQFNGLRSNLTGLPRWAQGVFGIVLIPGILLVALSIAAVVVSIAALLLVAVPVYSLLRAVTQGRGEDQSGLAMGPDPWRSQAKHVDATIRDAGDRNAPDEVNGE